MWSDAWVEDDGWKRAVADLKAKGVIEGFGISVNRWEADNVLKALDTGLVDAVQVVYNIFDQAPEDRALPRLRASWTSRSSPACRSTRAASPAR